MLKHQEWTGLFMILGHSYGLVLLQRCSRYPWICHPCRAIAHPPKDWWTVEWQWGTRDVLGGKPIPLPLCPPRIPQRLPYNWTRICVTRRQWHGAWAKDITPHNQSHAGKVLLRELNREFASILYNQKVHWRLRNSPPQVSIVSWISSYHFLKANFNSTDRIRALAFRLGSYHQFLSSSPHYPSCRPTVPPTSSLLI